MCTTALCLRQVGVAYGDPELLRAGTAGQGLLQEAGSAGLAEQAGGTMAAVVAPVPAGI